MRNAHGGRGAKHGSVPAMDTAFVAWTWLVPLGAFALAVSATPGPNNAMLTASGASWGFRRSVPHMLGITVGFPVMLLAVALGAGEVLRRQPWLEQALRWIGAAYLLWLAVRIARAKPAADGAAASGRPLGFLRAAAFQWVNPKAWAIAVSTAVTYSIPGASPLAQAVAVAVVFALISVATTALWTGVGVGAARVLRTRRALRGFNVAMAALLVASLLPLLRGE